MLRIFWWLGLQSAVSSSHRVLLEASRPFPFPLVRDDWLLPGNRSILIREALSPGSFNEYDFFLEDRLLPRQRQQFQGRHRVSAPAPLPAAKETHHQQGPCPARCVAWQIGCFVKLCLKRGHMSHVEFPSPDKKCVALATGHCVSRWDTFRE
eukprot:Gregarina_sp_Poly_1__3692@NODE_208_length_11377_cov_32_000884_g185_i0_p4_GENE_NODE_208_length_11377_cov_32_000884_g185_i0NODE_208_length_11377_cov_32_000884_g185_i0_p4_ORF_typecomplete_len152_score6_25_NODE_208_length_11377_cov_32_000884_g185_i064986953